MRTLLIISLFVTICVPCDAQEHLQWELEVPYPDINFGAHADVVVEPDTGRVAACGLRIEDTYSQIQYTRFFGRDGWVDGWRGFVWGGTPGTDFGEDVSMVVALAPGGLRTGFAYHNTTDSSLEYVEYPTVLVEVIADGSSVNQGWSNSLVFHADGTAHIATRTTSLFADEWLVHVHRVGSGGNCGVDAAAGAWQCDTVDVAEGIAEFISMDLDENGDPMIAYTSGSGVLNLAVHNGFGTGNCGYGNAAGMWDCTSLVASNKAASTIRATEFGGRVALAVDPSAPASGKHVAFLSTDTTTGDQSLDYATWVGSGGSCSDPRWNCMALAAVGDGVVDLDITVDGDGLPLIVYRDSISGDVRLAWGSDGGPGSGNCGPSGSWRCDIISEAPPIGGIGSYVSIASGGPGGQPVVAYSIFDPLALESDLRIAHPWISRDSFETGDLSWWDADVK